MSPGPPQMKAVDFQPRELTTSRWLRQEMRKVESLSPFMSTTLGWRSNADGCGTVAVADAEPELDAAIAEAGSVIPTAAQAAGFVTPAFTSAAAILPCCVRSADASGLLSGVSRMIS